jgi:hypothetical protein
MAVAPDKLDQLVRALKARGTPVAAHIGRCVEDRSGRIRIIA